MSAKLATGNVPGLLADYDTLPSDPAPHLVAAALRLSAHVLADDPGQLPSQLTGRLAGQHDPQLQDLLQRTRRWTATPWLRPLTASLTPAGGPLLRILTGHDGWVQAVAVSAGRPPRGLRRLRRDGAGVGPGGGHGGAHPDRPPTARSGDRGGGQRRRPPRGLRRQRRDGAGVGPGSGHGGAHPDRPRRPGAARWRSAPTAAARSPAATTGRCGCGTWRRARRCTPWPATTARCRRWRSAPTAAARSPAATTGRCGCGTWRRARRCTP